MDNPLGHLVLNEDGAVMSSGGELENGESVAQIVINLVNMTESWVLQYFLHRQIVTQILLTSSSIDPNVFPKNSCRKISIVYEKNSYEIFLSNRKIFVYKKRYQENLVDL